MPVYGRGKSPLPAWDRREGTMWRNPKESGISQPMPKFLLSSLLLGSYTKARTRNQTLGADDSYEAGV